MNKANSDPNQRTAVRVKSPACRCGELIGLPRNDSTLTLGTRNLWFSLQQLFWAMHENVAEYVHCGREGCLWLILCRLMSCFHGG